MCYVVGVNRIGEDVKEIKFSGASEVVNYNGEAVDMIPENEEKLSIATLSYEKLMVYRDRMSFHLDWDEYSM
jgi:predicted amidohydrolase